MNLGEVDSNFEIVYKILKYLERAMDVEEPVMDVIQPERLRITREHWERLLVMMQESGYISGLVLVNDMSSSRKRIVEPIRPEITLSGLEYLVNNHVMQRIATKISSVAKIKS